MKNFRQVERSMNNLFRRGTAGFSKQTNISHTFLSGIITATLCSNVFPQGERYGVTGSSLAVPHSIKQRTPAMALKNSLLQ